MNNCDIKRVSREDSEKSDTGYSLKKKVMIAVFVAALSMIVVFGLIVFFLQKVQRDSAIRKSVTYLDVLLKMEGEQFGNEIFEDRIKAVELRAWKVLSLEGILSVTVYSSDFRILAHNDRLGMTYPLFIKGVSGHQTGEIFTAQCSWNGIPALFYSSPIYVMREQIGCVNLFYSLADMEREHRVFYSLLIVLLSITFFILVAIMQWLLAKAIINPIKGLQKAMIEVEVSGPGNELSVVAHDEIGELFVTFNGMSKQLKDTLTKLQIEINDRKKIELELSTMQRYLTDIINSMPSSLIVVDKELVVTQWNTEAALKTGFLASFAVGKYLPDVFPMMTTCASKIIKAINEKIIITEPKIVESNDSAKTYYDLVIYPLLINGTEGAVIRLDDVSERVRLEEIMIQSEKMLSVGGLAAGMAHEINNPLSGMIQSVEVLARRLTGDLEINLVAAEQSGITMEEIKEYMTQRDIPVLLSRLKDSGIRVSGIVKNMLSFARKNDFVFERVDIQSVLDQTIQLAASDYDLKKEYDFKTITIVKNYEAGCPLVECEVTKIQQVLLNILRNGAEAMQDKKKKLDADAGGEYKPVFTIDVFFDVALQMVTISIADNGTGVKDDDKKKIFEPFFTTKSPGQGTGLGLSVSYFIITKNHGGKMSFESEYGKGTKIIIKLPVNKKPFDFDIEKKLDAAAVPE